MFTYDKVKELFGRQDRDSSELVLKLSVSYPCLKVAEIFSIYKLTFDNYMQKSDEIEDSLAWSNRKFHGKTLLQIQEEKVDPKENLHSTYIFRNFYRVIDQTDLWREQIRKKSFIAKFTSLKNRIFSKTKRDYRNQRLLDLFETTCEFIDLIEKKANGSR